ncbi:MAG: ImmA/IrrE family metallo-endopeptidase [Clostridiales bacterium]|nr:ImmA/IrrE family metallo-endopeptidase [Clostridiales bacterium]
MSNIKCIVEKLRKKYGTTSPYELCDLMGIRISRCELGTIRGYYHHAYRIKQIFLNCNLSKHEELLVLSHELGHAVMHPNSNTPFFKGNTLMSVDKMEIQANTFAMYILISDDDLIEYKECSLEQLSRIYGYDERLIRLRIGV